MSLNHMGECSQLNTVLFEQVGTRRGRGGPGPRPGQALALRTSLGEHSLRCLEEV